MVFGIGIIVGGWLMIIGEVEGGIYVVDDFLTEAEERAIAIKLKGEVWRCLCIYRLIMWRPVWIWC